MGCKNENFDQQLTGKSSMSTSELDCIKRIDNRKNHHFVLVNN